MPYIEFKNVNKNYKMGEITIKALDNTNFQIEKITFHHNYQVESSKELQLQER